MLQKQVQSGVAFYVSPLLLERGVAHAFSTRIGGASPAPFDSLNLGNPNRCDAQDDYERIWENYRLLSLAAGCSAEQKPCRVHQIHGANVARVIRGEPFDTSMKADAIVSDDPSRVISVRVADCVPILLADENGRAVAAVHAGWRGVVGGVVRAALLEMSRGGSVGGFVAAIGPCIGFEAFEVGPEVLDAFANAFGPEAPCRRRGDGKGHVDLREAVRRQLLAAGIPNRQIDTTDRCTYRDKAEFFSHRRENGVTGRMAAIIQPRQ